VGLMLHPYHALQASLATLAEGPDGKKHLPEGQSVLRPLRSARSTKHQQRKWQQLLLRTCAAVVNPSSDSA
jgi:hypothetical protein